MNLNASSSVDVVASGATALKYRDIGSVALQRNLQQDALRSLSSTDERVELLRRLYAFASLEETLEQSLRRQGSATIVSIRLDPVCLAGREEHCIAGLEDLAFAALDPDDLLTAISGTELCLLLPRDGVVRMRDLALRFGAGLGSFVLDIGMATATEPVGSITVLLRAARASRDLAGDNVISMEDYRLQKAVDLLTALYRAAAAR